MEQSTSQTEVSPKASSLNFSIPISIIVAGGLIALAIVARGGVNATPAALVADRTAYRPENGHLFGNPDASIRIVEFSDYECPFCGRVHPTLERIVAESEGRVSWEYRHLPLPFHSQAIPAAIASECVGRLAGNDAFWQFSDTLFKNQQFLGTTLYAAEASALGIDASDFSECLLDPNIAGQVEIDSKTAEALGGSGTPFSIVLFPDGTSRAVPGALPYEQWVALLNVNS